MPSVERDICVAETVRRQVGRPFGRSPSREEAVIRARFEILRLCPLQKIETMRHAIAVADEIVCCATQARPLRTRSAVKHRPHFYSTPSDTIRRFQYPFVRIDTRRDNCSSTLCQNCVRYPLKPGQTP